MKEDVRKNRKTQLALAIARGESITAWARQNEVPLRTAFRWASDPKVRHAVELWRRRALNRAIGRMTSLAMKAANGIARLGASAESESVQLRAWRAILADQMAVSKFSDLEYRMVEIEEQIRDRTGHTNIVGQGTPGYGYGPR
jgi:hypothetical protein